MKASGLLKSPKFWTSFVASLQVVSPRSRHRRIICCNPVGGGQRGRPKRVGAKLCAEQEKKIRSLIIEKNPMQLKLDFALWTRRAVKALIKLECQVDLPLSTVGVYLRSWGMSAQRLALRVIEGDEQRVKQWKETEYSASALRAKKETLSIGPMKQRLNTTSIG